MRLRFVSMNLPENMALSLSAKENWHNVRRLANWKIGDYIIFTDRDSYSCIAVAQVAGDSSINYDPIFKIKRYESRIPIKLCSDYRIKNNSSLFDIWNLLEDPKSLRKPWPHKGMKFWNMRLIDESYAGYILDRLCERKGSPKEANEDVIENSEPSSDYESQRLIEWFWKSTGLSYRDKGFCRHTLHISGHGSFIAQSEAPERLLAFTILGVFLDQIIYTHFSNSFGHSSEFRHPESVYNRFYRAFRLPKYFSCSASGSIGAMVPAIALLELLDSVNEDSFYSEIDMICKLLISDIYAWFRENIGRRAQFILHNYLLAEIIIEMDGCEEAYITKTESKISCLLKAVAESANSNKTP